MLNQWYDADMARLALTIPNWPITSRYGWRILKVSGVRNFHAGIDQASGTKHAIRALARGKVVAIAKGTPHRVYGWYVRVESADGIEWSVHSLDKEVDLRLGQDVSNARLLGHAGMSAMAASGYHCHYQLWVNSTLVDPLLYLYPGQPTIVDTNAPPPYAAPTSGASSPLPSGALDPTPEDFEPDLDTTTSGEEMFVAVRQGKFYQAVPRFGQITVVPLGAEDVTENVPIVRYVSDAAWATFRVCVGNPGVLEARGQ